MRRKRRGSESQWREEEDNTSRLSMDLEQLRPGGELGADRAVILVGTAGLCVGPGKAAADRWIVGLRVNGAHVVSEKDTTPATHARPPFPPPGAIGHGIAVGPDEGNRLVVTEGDAVGTARGMVRTRIAWQRWKIAHAAN
jgi:hypothetical protein